MKHSPATSGSMKAGTASLYVQGYDLLLWLVRFAEKLPRSRRVLHGDELLSAARAFVQSIMVALDHPAERAGQLVHADAALVRLRLALRLAGDCGVFTQQQRLFLIPQVEALGRMLGGWRKQEQVRLRLASSAGTVCPGDRTAGEIITGSPGGPGGRLEQ